MNIINIFPSNFFMFTFQLVGLHKCCYEFPLWKPKILRWYVLQLRLARKLWCSYHRQVWIFLRHLRCSHCILEQLPLKFSLFILSVTGTYYLCLFMVLLLTSSIRQEYAPSLLWCCIFTCACGFSTFLFRLILQDSIPSRMLINFLISKSFWLNTSRGPYWHCVFYAAIYKKKLYFQLRMLTSLLMQ